jgi:serine/threonine-protein phosphatase PP1 catalytic subunit
MAEEAVHPSPVTCFKDDLDSESLFSPANRLAGIASKLFSIRGMPRGTSAELTTSELSWLCDQVQPIFESQPILLELSAPIVICGDTHGQYPDLLRIFDAGGELPNTQYLFLGDYVDRGYQSIETISLLFLYKIQHPNRIFLLRGNHECSYINRLYGFYDDILRHHSMTLYRRFTEVFNWLPIAAIVDRKIFCVHGGLSPALNSLEDIQQITRPREIPEFGLLCDLVWADPDPDIDDDWGPNDRGTSIVFGAEVVRRFCEQYGFDLICRAHQAVMDGFEFPFRTDQNLITIFSAPNYCGEFENKGAILKVDQYLCCTFVLLEPVVESDQIEEAARKGTPPRGIEGGDR